jgi:hypothetical protein
MTREELLKSALELSDADRLLLATELMETVSADLPGWSVDDPQFLGELERRANDGSPEIPWEVARDQLRADLDR